jgi:hypothetical protein
MAKINKQNKIGVYCDKIDDHTNHLFRGWPKRLCFTQSKNIISR